MPKNITGGNKSRSNANGESDRSKKNKRLVGNLLSDFIDEDKLEDVYVGRVTRKFGNGRMEVFYIEQTPAGPLVRLVNCPLAGRMRGRGKKDVWVDVGSVVIMGGTGMGGSLEFEIIGVLNHDQCRELRKVAPDIDPRIFSAAAEPTENTVLFEKEEEEEIDLDTI